MYFSTNSRYVLNRAQWLTPSTYILKGAERLLSVKVPNDDPSKPALRVNIPKDASYSEKQSKLIHNATNSGKNFAEPRSRSLVSRSKNPSLNSSIRDDMLPKSESESQLLQIEAEDMMESYVLKEPNSKPSESYANQNSFQTSDREGYNVAQKSEDEYREGLSTPLHDPVVGEALANSYVSDPAFNSASYAASDQTNAELVQSEASAKSQNQENSDRMLYIIVDSPEEPEEKYQYKSVADSYRKEGKTPSPLTQDDFAAVKIPTSKLSQTKSGLQKPESWLFKKNKSLQKKSTFKPDGKHSGRRIEVQEIEDVATYILHSKPNKDIHSKSFGVKCVPEKEITTRSESLTYNEIPIKVPGGGSSKSFRGLSNEMAPVEELPDFVKPELRRKQRSRSSDPWGQMEVRSRPSAMNKNSYSAPFPTLPAVDKRKTHIKPAPSREGNYSNVRDTPEYLHRPVDSAAEKEKGFRTHKKDPFDAGKSVVKSTAFKMPSQVSETKPVNNSPEETAVSAKTPANAEIPASYSYPAEEAKPEYNLTKVETEPADVQTLRNEYFSPWKDNSDNHPKDLPQDYPDVPQGPVSSSAQPKPAPPFIETPREQTPSKKFKKTSKKHGKYMDSKTVPEKIEVQSSNSSKSEKPDSEGVDFKTSASFVSIGCDRVSSLPMKFSAAFPPLLCEALKIRGRILGFRREFLINDKWTEKLDYSGKHLDTSLKSSQRNEVDLSENSILFPKMETDKFECSLFARKDEMSLDAGKEPDGDKSPKISDNIANVANESLTEIKGQASVDSLDMMKKVKKIVEFELENAIKIFKKEEPPAETPSVMILEGDKWKVDTETLEKCIQFRKGDPTTFDDQSSVEKIAYKENVFGDKRNDLKIQDFPRHVPISLPSKRESGCHMKLADQSDSVISFNCQTNEFFLNEEALAKPIRRRADEFFDDVIIQTLEGQLTKGAKNESIVVFDAKDNLSHEMKSGDSILVFDEETHSWKVDYSILEKREQQLRMEEELTKRSELILETFENLEKGNITKIPKPDTKDKKFFDYGKNEWRVYPTEKKSTEKPSKSKYPFKESNAEEIRKSNSDLYENLFVGNKKETTMNTNNGNPQSDKGSKSCSSIPKRMASGSGSQKDSGIQKEPDSSNPGSKKLPPAGEGGGKTIEEPNREDDNFWESFLKMNILPRDISEIPKIRTPPPPPPPPPPPSPTLPPPKSQPSISPPPLSPPLQTPKTDIPKPITPPPKTENPEPRVIPKKIEEPRIKSYIPFIGNRKTEDTKVKEAPKEAPKQEDPKKKPPGPPPSAGGAAKEDSKVKAPPPSAPGVAKEDSKIKAPPPSVPGTTKEDSKIKAPPPSATGAAKEDSKVKPPPPGATGATKEDSKIKAPLPSATGAAKEDSKVKPPPPGATGATKEDSKIKAPPPSAPGVAKDDSKIKAPPPSAPGVAKDDSKIKAPPQEAPKLDPKKKSPEAPPTAAGDSKQDIKLKVPPATALPEEDPTNNKPTIGVSSTPFVGETKVPPFSPPNKVQDPKPSAGGKKDKSAADHYVSENIVQISRNTIKEVPTKFKTNKIETVKLNITSEKRMPSKVTEINLNKKCEEKGKEPNTALKKPNPGDPKKPVDVTSKKNEKCSVENKSFYKNFEKYKTPFSDPEYEEKSMKIKSDIESNPNLKKLDNWNKTLVLHDIGKPPENVESWLKDETDKMATLLLKVLQEATDGKPRKKQPPTKLKSGDKPPAKGSPFDSTQKRCETTPENFLFRVRTVNLALEDGKSADERKPHPKPTPLKEAAGEKAGIPHRVIDATKLFSAKEAQQLNIPATVKSERVPSCKEVQKAKHTALQSVEPSAVSKDLAYRDILPLEVVEEVPGPEFLKKLSNTWKMFPIIGSQMTLFTLLRAYQLVNLKNSFFGSSNSQKNRTDAFAKLFMKYGPIVNVQGPLSGNVILIHKPEHFTSVFDQDALMPVRSVFDSLEQSRREAEDKVLSATISTDWSKPEWNALRRGSTDPILRGWEKFLDPAEVAGDSLISSIRKSRNSQNYVSEDFIEEIKRWSLEGICSIMFQKSFGFLDRKNTNMNWIMEPDKLFMAVEEASNYLNKCEKGFQAWRLMNTSSLVGLGQAYRSLSGILAKQLYQAEMNLKSKSEFIKEQSPLISEDLTFLESMLLNDGLTTEEITCNLIDIMLIGTNMMSSALGFLLYNLAQNVKVQNKLLKELKTALPSKSSRLDYQTLHSLKYLQACLKESLRLNIPVPLFSRMLQNDILLSNYIIPKGTYVVMDYRATCMKEQIFDDPEKFVPERWLNDEKWMKDNHPFDTFPLCHGARAELAKKVVEMQLWACVAKVVRNFGIEYHYGEIEETNTLISFPGKPLKLNFVERDS